MYASNNDINGKKRDERDIYIKISPSVWIWGDNYTDGELTGQKLTL
jgi:hypothetical protein